MHRTARAVVGLSLLFAAGPASAEQAPSLAAESLTSIFERIRQDIGYYEVQAARRRNDIIDPTKQVNPDPAQLQPNVVPAEPVCDIEDFDFDVTDVQANLQTVMAKTGTESVGLHIPLLGQEGSLDADVSREVSGTETVALTRRFKYSKPDLAKYQESEDYRQLETAHEQYHARNASRVGQANPVLPIADTLIELRRNLIRSAEKFPCFEWADVKPESSSITLEFLVQKAANTTVGFNFWIISAKAAAEIKSTNVNTLVVSFAPHRDAPAASQPVAQRFRTGQPEPGDGITLAASEGASPSITPLRIIVP